MPWHFRCGLETRSEGGGSMRPCHPDRLFLRFLDLPHQRVNLFRRQLGGELGHSVLAVADDVEDVIIGCGFHFRGDQRWSREMPPLRGFPVTLRAIVLEGRVRYQGRLRRRRLRAQGRERRENKNPEYKTRERKTEADSFQC
jgi:hypothetical protein